MTSWIRAQYVPGKAIIGRPILFETTDAGFCANFNQYLYAYAYAAMQPEQKALTVYDLQNCLSPSLPLIKNSFADVSGVTFVDSLPPSAQNIRKQFPKVMATVTALPIESLRATAQDIFRWSPAVENMAKDILEQAKLPAAFDLGIHIRAGDKITTREMTMIPIERYVAAAKQYQAESNLDELHIFIMTDTIPMRTQFIKLADPSWKIYYLPTSMPQTTGHVQAAFNNSPRRTKLAAYNSFLAELIVMQGIPDILCTLSSHVGRFLYYTVEHADGIMSLDVKMKVI